MAGESLLRVDSSCHFILQLINGEKISGILLESVGAAKKTDWVVVGVGLNVDELPVGETNLPATSLKKCGISDVTLKELLTNFMDRFNQELDLWKEKGFDPIERRWMEREYKITKLSLDGGVKI